MSTRIMATCWPLQMGPTEKAVLISLADNANDEGLCWPSVSTICERVCLSERAVRMAFSRLEALNVLRRVPRDLQSNHFWLTPEKYTPPAPDAEVHEMQHPTAPDAPPHCTESSTPLHDVQTEPSLNRNGTTKEPSERRASRLPEDWTIPEEWVVWAVGHHPTWSPAHSRTIADNFKDYWTSKAGKEARKLNWFSVWKMWVRKEKPLGAQPRKPLQPFSDVDYRKGVNDDGSF